MSFREETETETNPFTYKKQNNYFARTFRQINESIELTEKEIRTLAIFAILRIIDLLLTYIFYNKRNAYHLIRFIDYVVLFSSFIVTSAVFINKDHIITSLARQKSCSLDYRIVAFNKTHYVRMTVRKTADETLVGMHHLLGRPRTGRLRRLSRREQHRRQRRSNDRRVFRSDTVGHRHCLLD